MTAQDTDLIDLKVRIAELELELSWMKALLAQRGILPHVTPSFPPRAKMALWAELLAKGVIRLPAPAELAIAAEWQARPEEEKEAIRTKLSELRLDPPLSEIIHRMREGWYPDESEWASEP